MTKDQKFIKNMFWGCIAALVLVFLLSVGSFIVMNQNIRHEAANSTVVSLAGNMHMQSQRMALLGLSLASTKDAELRARLRSEIRELEASMEAAHRRLLRGESGDERGGGLPESLRQIYYDKPVDLDKKVQDFIAQATALADEQDALLTFDNSHLVSIILASRELLKDLAELTSRYRVEGEHGIVRLQSIASAVLTVTIIVIFVLAGVIFYPMLKILSRELQQRSQSAAALEDMTQKLQDHADELERSNKALNEFSGIIAHDLRAPLRTISAFGDLLKKKSEVVWTQQEQKFIELIQGAIARMDRLIVDLLGYSRVSSQVQSFEKIDLSELLEEVLFDLKSSIAEFDAKLTVDKLPTIEADRTQIRQVFQNLIQNALKFRHSQRKPEISIKAEKTNLQKQTAHRFEIRDNGIGFDPVHSKRIFQVFRRLHGESEYEGVGMGLAICQRIVERHGGDIWAEGEKDKGAAIIFVLPERQNR